MHNLLLGQKCFEEHAEQKYFSSCKNLEGSASEFLQKQSFSEASLKPEVIFEFTSCIIHRLAAAVGLLMCHGLFTEPLVNPLAVNGGVPRLIYKQLHRHMNPFITF